MVDHDPNGYPSYEQWIESKAGACPAPGEKLREPSDWPMPKPPPFLADDEGSDDPAKA